MPPPIRDALAWNPVLQGITLLRMGYYSNYDSHLLDVDYLAGWCIVSTLLAFVVERMARKALLARA